MRAMKDKELVLQLDGDDYEAVQRCISKRQGFGAGLIPPGGGNLAGRVIAEICRGWEEMLGKGYAGLDTGHISQEAAAVLNETHRELVAALDGILSIGKRDMSNPKYDGYFDAAREAVKKAKGG